jgi:hypothetical protein
MYFIGFIKQTFCFWKKGLKIFSKILFKSSAIKIMIHECSYLSSFTRAFYGILKASSVECFMNYGLINLITFNRNFFFANSSVTCFNGYGVLVLSDWKIFIAHIFSLTRNMQIKLFSNWILREKCTRINRDFFVWDLTNFTMLNLYQVCWFTNWLWDFHGFVCLNGFIPYNIFHFCEDRSAFSKLWISYHISYGYEISCWNQIHPRALQYENLTYP